MNPISRTRSNDVGATAIARGTEPTGAERAADSDEKPKIEGKPDDPNRGARLRIVGFVHLRRRAGARRPDREHGCAADRMAVRGTDAPAERISAGLHVRWCMDGQRPAFDVVAIEEDDRPV